MTTNDDFTARLTEALAAARDAARQEALNSDDGGTANLDTCLLIVPRVSAAVIQAAAQAAGVRVDRKERTRWWPACWWVWVHEGQGSMRTRMAEAAKAALEAHGFESSVWYQMD